jgi:glucose/arabinose dehydrogenase
VDRSGYIRTIATDGTVAQVLDTHAEVNLGYDSGLLSIAFHPKFEENGFVYLAFTTPYPTQPPPACTVFLSVLARFHSNDRGLTIDPASEKRLLVRSQPTVNHHGNKVVFGPDGYLYFACGDGAVLASPNGQDKNALFGKVLRLDVDSGDPYGIPPTNPFGCGSIVTTRKSGISAVCRVSVGVPRSRGPATRGARHLRGREITHPRTACSA